MRSQLSKILAVVMVLAMAVSIFSFSVSAADVVTPDAPAATADEATPDELQLGDVDANGKVDVRDATLVQKYVADLATLDEAQIAVADVQEDGKINVKDATAIQKMVAGLPIEPPVTTPDEPVVTPDEATKDEATKDEATADETTPDEPVANITITLSTQGCGWINDADAYVVLVDVDTDSAYTMTKGDGVWTAEVPETVVNVRFDRCSPAGDVWNAWDAGNRGEFALYYPTDNNVGSWMDAVPEVEAVTIYFDNSVTNWDVVAFYQWSDSSFPGYTVMTQVGDSNIYSLEITSTITTGLFKGEAADLWTDATLKTENITIDTATNGNAILYTVTAGSTAWAATGAPYVAE